MSVTPRAVALLLAFSISCITIAFLSLVQSTSGEELFVAGAISFSSAFILIYVAIKFMIFREIEKIHEEMNRLSGSNVPVGSNYQYGNPLKQINREIVQYVSKKENEIDQLKKLEIYRREFIADISHELKTPIFAAQGYILTLQDGAVNDKSVRGKFLKKAAKSLNRLDSLVQDLLTLSRIESGAIVMQFQICDIQALVLEVFEHLENKAKKKNVTLQLAATDDEGVYVKADPDRIMQVLINLINNAIVHGREDGQVEVALQETPSEIEVSVSDNGEGIPEEHLGRLFERFYRVDKSRTKKQGTSGSGLGLAITKHIIEGHHSKITVESELEKGTTFRFALEKS